MVKNSDPRKGGIGTDNAKGKFLAQVAYGGPQWSLSAAYAYIQNGATVGLRNAAGCFNHRLLAVAVTLPSPAVSLTPMPLLCAPGGNLKESGWIPSISAGWGLTSFQQQRL